MTKNKIFAYIISIASVLSLASCGDIDVNIPTSQPASDKVAEVTTIKEDNTQNNVAETQITEAAVNQETEQAVTEASKTEETVSDTTSVTTVTETQEKPEEVSIVDTIKEKASAKSPLLNGYSEYTQILNNHYTLEILQTGFKYGYNCEEYQLISTTSSLADSYGTITNITDSSLTPDDMEKFQDLYKYIEENVDQKYSVYDAYIEEYCDVYASGESGKNNHNDQGKGYHIDIVLEKDMSSFDNASPADRHMFLTRFENDITEGTIKDGLVFKQHRELIQELFIKDANKVNSDIAFGIDNISFSCKDENDNTIGNIRTPLRRAIRKCDINETGATDSAYFVTIKNPSYAVNKGSLKNPDQYIANMDISMYLKAGTNPDIIPDVLESYADVFEEYNVHYITVDILDHSANFDNYKNANGYVSYETVQSKARYYHYNTPESDFEIGGK